MYLVEKKQGWIVYNKKLWSQMRRNQILRNGHCDVISKYSFPQVIVKNDGCISSRNKRGEQAFYTKYTGK